MDKIYFINEKLPYNIMATSDNFIICSRKLNKRQDNELLWELVENGSYFSFKRAYDDNKENPIYTILDFKKGVRGPDNHYNLFDYFDKDDCESAINMLESGELEVSSRNSVPINLDFNRMRKIYS